MKKKPCFSSFHKCLKGVYTPYANGGASGNRLKVTIAGQEIKGVGTWKINSGEVPQSQDVYPLEVKYLSEAFLGKRLDMSGNQLDQLMVLAGFKSLIKDSEGETTFFKITKYGLKYCMIAKECVLEGSPDIIFWSEDVLERLQSANI